ncbi:MAG: hypothetical protein ACOCUH_00275 [Bacteriovoracia bacterium]
MRFLLLLLIFAVLPVQAQMIEFGTGVTNSSQGDASFLVKVEGDFSTDKDEDVRWVLIKFDAEMANNGGKIDYMDVEFRALGAEFNYDNYVDEVSRYRSFIGANLLSGDFERNMSVGKKRSMRISLLGVSTGVEYKNDYSKIEVMANLAVDFLTLSFDQMRSDGATASHIGDRAGGKVDFDIMMKVGNFRITFGHEREFVYTNGDTYYTGNVVCDYYDYDPYYDDQYYDPYYDDPYYDPYYYDYSYYGTGYSRCYDETVTDYKERWIDNETYLTVAYDITKNLSVFGRASYNVYKVSSRTGDFANTKNAAWQFVVGVNYKLSK